MKKDGGFVLLPVLLILSITLMFTLSQWQGMMLFQRLMNRTYEQAAFLFGLENAFYAIQRNLNDDLEQAGEVTWDGKVMNYKVEHMGDFSCIQRVIKGIPFSTRHQLVTIWLHENPQMRLEIRVATLIPLSPCPSHLYRLVSTPILSWNYKEERGGYSLNLDR